MRRRIVLFVALVLLAAMSVPTGAQTPPDSVPPDSAISDSAAIRAGQADSSTAAHPFRALAVRERAWSPAVAVALVLPRGSGSDPEDMAGASWLLAQAATETARRSLDSLPARLAVEVDRGRTSFVLLTVPGRWRDALDALDRALFSAPPDPAPLETVRADLLDQLGFEEGAPIRSFQTEMDRLLYGSSHPWARPIRGYPATVEAVTPDVLARHHRRAYRRADAAVAVVGPVTAEEVRTALPRPRDTASAAPPADPLPPGPSRQQGVSFRVTRDVTSTWIGTAYPVSPDLSRTHAEFLAHVLHELLISDPPSPGMFGATVRLRDGPDGLFLFVEAALFPGEEVGWEARVRGAVERLGARTPEDPFFRIRRRRFRSARLLELGRPEGEALTAATDLLAGESARDLAREIAELGPEDLRRAAATLGPPRILVLGPDLSDRDGGAR